MTQYHVLVIDDDESSHEVLGEYLRLSGFRVTNARDGQQGLQAMADSRPDLVLLDVQMPHLDGFGVLERAAREPELSAIPILLVTSLDRHYLKIKGLEAGATDYITKPYNSAEVLARVRAALRHSTRYQRASSALRGELAEFNLGDILQMLEIGNKTARLLLPQMDGAITTQKRCILGARQGAFEGREALTRMFFLQRGSFSVDFDTKIGDDTDPTGNASGDGSAPPPPTDGDDDPIPITHLLMDTLTYIDETRRQLDAVVPDLQRVVALSDPNANLAEFPELAAVAAELPAPLEELIVRMPREIKTNAQIVLDALQHGIIRQAG